MLNKEAGCPPHAFQHSAAWRPLIADNLGPSGRPGCADAEGQTASQRKACLPLLDQITDVEGTVVVGVR